MEIGPIKQGNPALSEQVKKDKASEPAEDSKKQKDDVEISAEAQRFLSTQETTDENNATDGQDRLGKIRERIDSGFYDRQVIRDVTVERMIDEMLEDINRFYK